MRLKKDIGELLKMIIFMIFYITLNCNLITWINILREAISKYGISQKTLAKDILKTTF